jgi:hypothetical protein
MAGLALRPPPALVFSHCARMVLAEPGTAAIKSGRSICIFSPWVISHPVTQLDCNSLGEKTASKKARARTNFLSPLCGSDYRLANKLTSGIET